MLLDKVKEKDTQREYIYFLKTISLYIIYIYRIQEQQCYMKI